MSTGSKRIARYVVYEELASGGMGAVHYGKVAGSAGFSRAVAIKRLHAHFAKDDAFRAMLLDEAHLAARIRHPNVVPTIDVVEGDDGELLLVMEFVVGESLSRLLKASHERAEPVPIGVVLAIIIDVLHGLHAAHEATGASGEFLALVHRDVSPQNVLVGADGHARVVDFGIAKAAGRLQATGEGVVKGKVSYMSPEQIRGEPIDRRADVFGTSVVLWELLTSQRLFEADSQTATMTKVLSGRPASPRARRPEVSLELEAIVMRGLALERDERFPTAQEMAKALENVGRVASATDVAAWLAALAPAALDARKARIAAIERGDEEGVSAARPSEVPTQLSGVSTVAEAPAPRRRSRMALATAMAAVLATLVGAAAIVRALTTKTIPSVPVPIMTTATTPNAPATPSVAAPETTETTVPSTAPAHTSVAVHHVASRVAPPPTVAPAVSSAPAPPRMCLRKIPDDAGVLIPTHVPCD